MEDRHKFIWICSYPKSGNTWMRLLLREYFRETTGEPPFETSDTSPYWYQVVSPKPLNLCTPEDIIQLRSAAMAHLTTTHEWRLNTKPATLVKSHMASGELAGLPFFHPLWVDYAVYIYRDPRDILPSFASHMGTSLDEAADALAGDRTTLGQIEKGKIPTLLASWSDHVSSWVTGERQRVSTIVTSYERLHASAAGELERVLRFCDIEPDLDAIQAAVKACEFSRLQAREAREGFPEQSPHGKFFRRGLVGSHEDEVPAPLVGKIERDHALRMKILGYL